MIGFASRPLTSASVRKAPFADESYGRAYVTSTDGKWKALWTEPPHGPADGHWQLYDLTKDRGENNDLSATNPDVLIASYSGLTQEEYDAVTGAGIPVIAPEEALWATPWRDVITDTGRALGMEDEADAVLADLDQQIADAAAEHPEFDGLSIAYADDDVDTFYLYLPADPRVEILEDLGFTSAESVTALDSGESTFYTTVSSENLDQIDADVLFTQAEQQADIDEFLASDRAALIPAVAAGAVAPIVGEENVAAISPTALTLPWILPDVVEQLAAAAAAAAQG